MAWCYLPDTASPSAQAAADLTWVLDLPSRALPPPATSRSRNTPAAPSSQGSGPDTSTPRQSGTTSSDSTPCRGAGRSTPCSQDTHVSRFPKRDSERARMTPATFGPTSNGSSKSSATGCAGAYSRMLLGTSPLALKPWCAPYKEWVSALRLAYSQRKKLARRTKGSGFSSWPTADTPSGGRSLPPGTTATGITPDGRKLTVGLENAAVRWPTPMAGTPAQNGNNAAGNNDFTRKAEELASAMRGTPRGSDGEKGGPNMSFGAGGTPLPAQAAKWPTPASRDHKGENGAAHLTNGTGRLHLDQLPNFVAHCFTHPAQRTWTTGVPSSIWRPISRRLLRSATSQVSQVSLRRWLRRGTWRKRRLNPLFVEWLMGWPPGHALCACSETGFTHWQQHMRGALSAMPTASGAWIWGPPVETAAPEQLALF